MFWVKNSDTYMKKNNVDSLSFTLDEMPSFKIGTPTIVAVHTRAATKGTPEDNDNNHPVKWMNVLVTHNGAIQNDEEIKEKVRRKPKKVPEVDSAAIAAILDHSSDNPEEGFEEILKGLGFLKGGFAFHAVWLNNPGYSLLVRGNTSPLHFYFDDEGIFLYSSEATNVRAMMDVIGIDGEVRTFDPRAVLLLKDGSPCKWGTIIDTWNTTAKKRATRRTADGRPWMESSVASFYGAEGATWTLPQDGEARLIVLKGEQADGQAEDWNDFAKQSVLVGNLKLPIMVNAALGGLSEADSIHRFSKGSGAHDCVSAQYGDIEVIVNKNGQLVDIFNWNKNFERFTYEDLPAVAAQTFEQWFKAKTTLTRVATPLPLVKSNRNSSDTSRRSSTYKVRSFRGDGLPVAFFGNKEFTSIQGIANLPRNRYDESVCFVLNEKCQEHNMWVINHKNPTACQFVQLAALAALERSYSVASLMAMVRGKMKTGISTSEVDKEMCKAHQWKSKKSLSLPFDAERKHHVVLPFVDECPDCKAIRAVMEWPAIIANHAKRMGVQLVTI